VVKREPLEPRAAARAGRGGRPAAAAAAAGEDTLVISDDEVQRSPPRARATSGAVGASRSAPPGPRPTTAAGGLGGGGGGAKSSSASLLAKLAASGSSFWEEAATRWKAYSAARQFDAGEAQAASGGLAMPPGPAERLGEQEAEAPAAGGAGEGDGAGEAVAALADPAASAAASGGSGQCVGAAEGPGGRALSMEGPAEPVAPSAGRDDEGDGHGSGDGHGAGAGAAGNGRPSRVDDAVAMLSGCRVATLRRLAAAPPSGSAVVFLKECLLGGSQQLRERLWASLSERALADLEEALDADRSRRDALVEVLVTVAVAASSAGLARPLPRSAGARRRAPPVDGAGVGGGSRRSLP